MHIGYPVWFTDGVFELSNRTLADVLTTGTSDRTARALVVVDDGVSTSTPSLLASIAAYFQQHSGEVELAEPPLVVTGGERAKNDEQVVRTVLERLFALRMDRHGYLVVVGGGAVIDAVGYAASLFHRGMRLVRLPTTVLAQDDAGIGVKNGINAYGVKNALGTFAAPHAVINDFELLRTLPLRDHLAGISEAIKVALIRDASFFSWIEQHAAELRERAPAATRTLIRRCAELHLQHIAQAGDPFETGSARPLDFGHWAAHKLEVMTRHELRHGEAVALGMALDPRYAQHSGWIDAGSAKRILDTIDGVGLPLTHPALATVDADGALAVLRGLEEFREHLGGKLTVTMLHAIGKGVEVHEIDSERMALALRTEG